MIINIQTHGSVRKATRAHTIILANDEEMEVSEMKEILAKFETKKVNVALIDNSCFSGGSLALASERTCVVTATSERIVSYNNFPVTFWRGVSAGLNIEDVYRKARLQNSDLVFPSISSGGGQMADRILSSLQHSWEYDQYGMASVYNDRNVTPAEKNMSIRLERNKPVASPLLSVLNNLNSMHVRISNSKAIGMMNSHLIEWLDRKNRPTNGNRMGNLERDFQMVRNIWGTEKLIYDDIYDATQDTLPSACKNIHF